MPTIYTGEWLKSARLNRALSVEELALKINVSVNTIYKIEAGERIGSPSTWEKINNFFLPPKISVSSEKFIDEISEEIELYGENEECTLFYTVKNGAIIFYDYLIPEDKEMLGDSDLKEKSRIRVTLKEALELFEAQNSII